MCVCVCVCGCGFLGGFFCTFSDLLFTNLFGVHTLGTNEGLLKSIGNGSGFINTVNSRYLKFQGTGIFSQR